MCWMDTRWNAKWHELGGRQAYFCANILWPRLWRILLSFSDRSNPEEGWPLCPFWFITKRCMRIPDSKVAREELPKMPIWWTNSVFFSQVGRGYAQGSGMQDCGIFTCLYAAAYLLGLLQSKFFWERRFKHRSTKVLYCLGNDDQSGTVGTACMDGIMLRRPLKMMKWILCTQHFQRVLD